MDFFKDLNLDCIREDLLQYVQRNPMSMHKLAKDLGTSYATLRRLLESSGSRKSNLKILLTVRKYLDGKNAEEMLSR